MDELDVTAAESKAAYKEVRDYVWGHHLTSKSPVCATWNRHRLGIFSGSVISDAGGSVLTGKAAEGGAAACGGTSHQAGIAAGEVSPMTYRPGMALKSRSSACMLSSIWMPSMVQMR